MFPILPLIFSMFTNDTVIRALDTVNQKNCFLKDLGHLRLGYIRKHEKAGTLSTECSLSQVWQALKVYSKNMGSYSPCLRYPISLGTLVWKGSQILVCVRVNQQPAIIVLFILWYMAWPGSICLTTRDQCRTTCTGTQTSLTVSYFISICGPVHDREVELKFHCRIIWGLNKTTLME